MAVNFETLKRSVSGASLADPRAVVDAMSDLLTPRDIANRIADMINSQDAVEVNRGLDHLRRWQEMLLSKGLAGDVPDLPATPEALLAAVGRAVVWLGERGLAQNGRLLPILEATEISSEEDEPNAQ